MPQSHLREVSFDNSSDADAHAICDQRIALAHDTLRAIQDAMQAAGHPDCPACVQLAPVLASYLAR